MRRSAPLGALPTHATSAQSTLAALAIAALLSLAQSAHSATPNVATPTAPANPPAATSDLDATWQTPWNPPHAMSRRSPWEHVVLLPGRIVSLPLSALGYMSRQSLGTMEQRYPALFGPSMKGGHGFRTLTPRLAHLGDRSGVGVAIVAQAELPRSLGSRLGLEYAASNKLYNRTQATWMGRPLSLQYGYEWRPQERFYGEGTAGSKDSVSDYAMQREFVRASAHWAWGHDPATERPRAAFNVWAEPRSEVTRTGREPGQLSYDQRFPGLGTQTLNSRVEHFIYGMSALLDHRAGAPHWSRGWRVLASAEQFGAPVRALALHSGLTDGATFSRYDVQAETGVSMFRDPRTLRLAVHLTDQQVTSGRERFLLADMATLGGQPGLSWFAAGRFHDMDLLLTRLTYVFPLIRRLELDVHSEWGAVYPDVWHDASLSSFHHSMGFALHSRNALAPRGSLGLDFSSENVRVIYSLGASE